MSLEEGEAYNARLMPLMRGDQLPSRKELLSGCPHMPAQITAILKLTSMSEIGDVPVDFIMYDLWEEMRAASPVLADGILEPTFTFMRAQTDKARLLIKELGHYLVYRERDVGKASVSIHLQHGDTF
jgi:aristolochene synthase